MSLIDSYLKLLISHLECLIVITLPGKVPWQGMPDWHVMRVAVTLISIAGCRQRGNDVCHVFFARELCSSSVSAR